MTDDFITIGKITSTFGLKGFLKVSSSGDVLNSLSPKTEVFLQIDNSYKSFKLIEIRPNKNSCIISLEGFDSIEKSESLVGNLICFPRGNMEILLEKDEFFISQLIGLMPHNETNQYSDFAVKEVLENPVHPILVFSNQDIEILIPYINQFIGKVDIDNRKIEVLNWEDWIHAD